MLSILIPIYNHDCTALLQDLHKQAEQLGIPYEIIAAEDGSANVYDYEALGITTLHHILRKENVGRAAIRNILLKEARYELLLLMDCDVTLPREDFLQRYLSAAQHTTADCYCGGNQYPDQRPPEGYRLRYAYEKHYERRRKKDERSGPVWTSSLLLRRRVIEAGVWFDESYRGYGYEDVQFGKDIREAGFTVCHIDNPILNTILDADADYLGKLDEAMHTLALHRDALRSESALLRTAEHLLRWHLAKLVSFPFLQEPQNLLREPQNLHREPQGKLLLRHHIAPYLTIQLYRLSRLLYWLQH